MIRFHLVFILYTIVSRDMGGGLMQLVAYGAQDVYLTGSPQITFFKLVYRRHTNFAVESIEQVFNGTPGFGKKASATISRNGDLITQVFLQITVPHLNPGTDDVQLVNSFAHALVESCEIEIGGQRIDKHYAAYYEVCDELMCPEEKRIGYGKMVGKMYETNGMPKSGTKMSLTKLDEHMARLGSTTYYMPLRFWFNNNPGLALPLISLQYHEVKLQFAFSDAAKCVLKRGVGGTDPANNPYESHASDMQPEISLYVDYVYLDTEERRRFAQVSHEYLIEQLQFTGVETYSLSDTSVKTEKIRLNFNHPCKELIFFVHPSTTVETPFEFGEGITGNTDGVASGIVGYEYINQASLLLNGHDRFSSRKGSYFRLVVPFQVHTRVPSRHIYCYSFALRPEEHQPSGSCNFSRIDNASLHLTFNKSAIQGDEQISFTVYALSYNILRIMSGMGGLAYSN
jgi:hypothetical protein